MAAGALTLGVAHPPGYPLYLLLSHLWVKAMPLGNVAFRLNVFSALIGVLACALLSRVVSREEDGDGASYGPLCAFLLLGLAPAFWHLSLVSEMYSLNALVGAAVLWLMLDPGDPILYRKRIYAGALLFGLGLGNHQTLVAALPGYLWIARGELFGEEGFYSGRFWKRRAPALLFFTLSGLALYAYLPLRSMQDPVLDWGEPETFRNFFRMLTRADLGGVRLHPDRPFGLFDLRQWKEGLAYSARLIWGEFGWPGTGALLWGAWLGRRSRFVQGTLVSFFLSGPLFVVWANLDAALDETYAIIEPHLVLPLVFAAAVAGLGFGGLFKSAAKQKSLWGPAALAVLIAAGWTQAHAPGVAARMRHRNDFSAWDYGIALQSRMDKNALLFDPDDPTAFTLSYMTLAHHLRPDIVPLMYFRTWWGYAQLKKRHPELLTSWNIRSGQELLGSLIGQNLANGKSIYVDLPQKTPPGAASYPAGLVYRLFEKRPEAEKRQALFDAARRASYFVRIRFPHKTAGFFTRHTADYWATSLNNLGIESGSAGRPETAEGLYRSALSLSPGLAEAWNNLGNALLARGDLEGAEGAYRLSIRLKSNGAVIYNLGRTYLTAKKFAEAERTFRRAIAAGAPREARNDLGLVFLRSNRLAQAVSIWRELLDEDPYYLLAYYNLALTYEKMGRKDEAYSAVSAYAQLVGDPNEKRSAAAWMRRLKN